MTLEKLWKPDIYFANLLNFKELVVLEKLEGIAIEGTNIISMSTASVLTFTCRMFFHNYPFDLQDCPLHLSSTNHPAEEIEFNGTFHSEIEHMELATFSLHVDAINESETTRIVNKEIFSVTGVHIQLNRNYGAFLLRFVLPCCIMVCASFVNFLIPPEAIPGRVGLLATLFLVLTGLFTSVQVLFIKITNYCCFWKVFFRNFSFSVFE